jgi:hypothetical protein
MIRLLTFLVLALLACPPALAANRWGRSACAGGNCQVQVAQPRQRAVQPQSVPVRGCPDTCYGPNGCPCIDNGGTCKCHEAKAARKAKAAQGSVGGCASGQCGTRRGVFGGFFRGR